MLISLKYCVSLAPRAEGSGPLSPQRETPHSGAGAQAPFQPRAGPFNRNFNAYNAILSQNSFKYPLINLG